MQNKYPFHYPMQIDGLQNLSLPQSTSRFTTNASTSYTLSNTVNERTCQHISVDQIYFSQRSVSEYFSDGRALAQTVQDIIRQKISLDDIPFIRVVFYNKRWVTLDNRRLRVFKDAGVVSITAEICDLSQPPIKREFDLKKTHKAIDEGGEVRSSLSTMGTQQGEHFEQGTFIFTKKVLGWNITQIQTPPLHVQQRNALADKFENEEGYYAQFLDLILEEARAVLHQALDLIAADKISPVSMKLMRSKLAKNFANPSNLYFELQRTEGGNKATLKSGDMVLLNNGTLRFTGMVGYLKPEEANKQICLKSVIDEDMRKQHAKLWESTDSLWQLYPMESLITPLRMYEACVAKKAFSFIDEVIVGNLNLRLRNHSPIHAFNTFSLIEMQQSFSALSLSAPVEYPELQKLNASQAKAVKEFLDLQQGIRLIQGPPGTGKTTTLITLLQMASKNERRILVCAPSNKAVQILAERFLENSPDISAILVGVEDKLPDKPGLKNIFIHTWKAQIQSEIAELFDLTHQLKAPLILPEAKNASEVDANDEENAETLPILSQKERQSLAKIALALNDKFTRLVDRLKRFELPFLKKWIMEKVNFFMALKNYVDHLYADHENTLRFPLEWIETQRESLGILLGTLSHLGILFEGQDDEAVESALLNAVKVIFATLSVTGRKAFRELEAVDSLIIDEAGQAVEAETLIALQTNPKKCLLVGDTKQLPATVISKLAEKLKFDRSLLWRLLEDCRQPYVLLQEQYRMLPAISDWPSKRYYEGQLINAPRVTDTQYALEKLKDAPPFLGPYAFIDVEGHEAFAGRSLWNAAEQYAVVSLVKHLATHYHIDVEKQVGIISFYKAQIEQLAEKLHPRYPELMIQTVDGFQGGENDIIIISFVRANPKGNIGFLSDFRRLNVAITRARFALLMVGHSETLMNNEKDVAALIQDAKAREKVFSYTTIKSQVEIKQPKFTKQPHSKTYQKSYKKHAEKSLSSYEKNRCHFFNGTPGSCRRGEECTFSHDRQSLEKRETKTQKVHPRVSNPVSNSNLNPRVNHQWRREREEKVLHREENSTIERDESETSLLFTEKKPHSEKLSDFSESKQRFMRHPQEERYEKKWRVVSQTKTELPVNTPPHSRDFFTSNAESWRRSPQTNSNVKNVSVGQEKNIQQSPAAGTQGSVYSFDKL